MPIFMDRHDVSEEVTAEHVAKLHQQDLLIQHQFNCKGLTYWFDDKRKTAFCLIEAPNKEAIHKMHQQSHGAFPNKVIEVDAAVVESFLGRIEDPEKSKKINLNIINDPAFRVIMVAGLKQLCFDKKQLPITRLVLEKLHKALLENIKFFEGALVKQKSLNYLVSFTSVTNAVLCAEKMRATFNKARLKSKNPYLHFKIGLNAGVPVCEKESIFEDCIQMAERLFEVVKGDIALSQEVRELYESENRNKAINKNTITLLQLRDEEFLTRLMDYTEKEFANPFLNANEFCTCLGYSKSQLYRKIISLTGLSPNNYLKLFRLKKAMELLKKNEDNISEIAYETGFTTPAYFSKCFYNTFGILPSVYTKKYILS